MKKIIMMMVMMMMVIGLWAGGTPELVGTGDDFFVIINDNYADDYTYEIVKDGKRIIIEATEYNIPICNNKKILYINPGVDADYGIVIRNKKHAWYWIILDNNEIKRKKLY